MLDPELLDKDLIEPPLDPLLELDDEKDIVSLRGYLRRRQKSTD